MPSEGEVQPGLLSGVRALVSGIGPGLGRSIALAFADHGADLVLAARSQDSLLEVAAEVEARGRRAVWLPTDVTSADACARLVNHARIELGGIDVLVNNAFAGGAGSPLMDSDISGVWRSAMEVNFFGTLTMIKAAVPALAEVSDGRVININTMAVRDPQPGQGPYAASKAALAMATRTLAHELGPSGIRVNSVHPGYILGPAVEQVFERRAHARGTSPEVIHAETADRTVLGYIPDAEEIAGTVVFLASGLAKPITGQSIDVNAGYWM